MPELTEEEITRRDDIVAGLDLIAFDIRNQALTVEGEVDELNRTIELYRDELRTLNAFHEEVARRLADDDRDELAREVELAADVNEPENVDVEVALRIDLDHADAVREVDTVLATHAARVAEYA